MKSGSSQALKCPLSLSITRSALAFLDQILNFPQKLTKYVLQDEILVFFMRTHHINFVRLYNKSRKYAEKIEQGEASDRIKLNKVNSLALCKDHLKCLYSIARNRSQETRLKFYRFQIVSFLAQTISLETNYLASRKQFLNLSKKAANEANRVDLLDVEEANSPSKGQRTQAQESASVEEHVVLEQGYILDPIREIPSNVNEEIEKRINNLNTGSQAQLHSDGEEQSIERIHGEQHAVAPPMNQIREQRAGESSDSDMGLPPELPVSKPRGLGFSLAIQGLGLSTVAQEGGKTAEELADAEVL